MIINESKLNSIIKKQIKSALYFLKEEKNNDERLSDMNTETESEEKIRDSIEEFFKQPGVNCAAYAYKLYGVKSIEGEDTDEMKNARSKFMKCLNHEKNESGYPYSFTSAELNILKGLISSNQLNENNKKDMRRVRINENKLNRIIKESVKKILKEGRSLYPTAKWSGDEYFSKTSKMLTRMGFKKAYEDDDALMHRSPQTS